MNDPGDVHVEWLQHIGEEAQTVFDALLGLISDAVTKPGQDR